MISLRSTVVLALLAASSVQAQDFLDRAAQQLSFVNESLDLGARLSGTLDLEAYLFPQPPPGLIYAQGHVLFTPRLALFTDVQIGRSAYAFAQVRVDRGFDPASRSLRTRLDEYALRYDLLDRGRLTLQAGQFATVVGRWVQRHGSWENAFVTAPLAYNNLTAIWDSAAARSTETLLAWAHLRPVSTPAGEYADKHLRLPILWGPSYASGASAFGTLGRWDYAAEIKNAALSSPPDRWNVDREGWNHPTFSARLGYRPNLMWNLGWSASTGSYLRPAAIPSLASGYGLSDYRQTTLIQDIGFAWRHWQLWAEFAHARFQVPRVGAADTFAAFAEVKYKFTPRVSGALRLNRQTFGDLTDSRARAVPWGRDTWRLDLAPTFRLTAHLQARLQYSFQEDDPSPRPQTHTLATQLTLRF